MSRRAVAHLKRADPKLAALIAQVGPCRFAPRGEGTHFEAVVRSIVYQQLSGKAAGTILERVRGLFPEARPTAPLLQAMEEERLRSVGLSRQKIRYLKDLAQRTIDGTVAIESLHELDDDAAIAALTEINGVGRWTAQVFLMFRLGRPDVLPEGDLGIQKGIQRAYGLRALPKPERVKVMGERWAPYRTFAAWYLWRGLEIPDEVWRRRPAR